MTNEVWELGSTEEIEHIEISKPQELSGKEIEDYSTPLFGLHFWLSYNLNQSYDHITTLTCGQVCDTLIWN